MQRFSEGRWSGYQGWRHKGWRLLIAALFVCMILGCQAADPDRARIIGEWVIVKPESMMRRIDQEPESESENGDSPRMLLRFSAGGELETETRIGKVNQSKQGQWKLDSFDMATATMTITCTLQMQKTEHAILFLDDETIELTPPNLAGLSTKLKFKRQ